MCKHWKRRRRARGQERNPTWENENKECGRVSIGRGEKVQEDRGETLPGDVRGATLGHTRQVDVVRIGRGGGECQRTGEKPYLAMSEVPHLATPAR